MNVESHLRSWFKCVTWESFNVDDVLTDVPILSDAVFYDLPTEFRLYRVDDHLSIVLDNVNLMSRRVYDYYFGYTLRGRSL